MRIVDIPEKAYDQAITAIPYFVIEKDGESFTIYGDAQTQTYHSVLSSTLEE